MSQQGQQCGKHIQHTGLYVGDTRKRYEEELDPIGLSNWTDVKWPLTLHGDSVHFYEYANSIGKLGRNPFTRQPIQSLNDWEPIVHNDLSVEDYHADSCASQRAARARLVQRQLRQAGPSGAAEGVAEGEDQARARAHDTQRY